MASYHSLMETFFLSTVAFFAAIVSATIGAAGGTILIAAMFSYGLSPAIAIPLHAGVQLVSNGSRVIAYFKHTRFSAMTWFLAAAIPAPFLLAPLIVGLDANWIKLALAAFVLISLIPGLLGRLSLHNNIGFFIAGIMAGGVGMVVGATGLLIAPFFLRPDWRNEEVIATMALAQGSAHALKMIAFGTAGVSPLNYLTALLCMSVAVILGTIVGKRLNGQLNEILFRRLMRGLLVLLALQLAISAGINLAGA